MCLSNLAIDRANLTDVTGILELAQANDAEHGGMLLGHLEREAVSKTISQMPSVVARKDNEVVGFLLSWSKTSTQMPIITTMLQAYPGTKDAYLYGPICVEENMRGQGIAAAMFAKLKNYLPQRQGILFVKANNEASLRAHRKMGMCQMTEFTYQGTKFLVFAYDG
ncbi:GNAT family N-acetyltransferase [Nostocaceae cyanobacterium CENA369]|uniref:GNAT family N-acetyltransferase n=1 Tax=Dendronalium phyllosphericum CENA369 TaxID=1725256 RepID=A0A8J7IAR3_9NOST|nr:GNAT family N-acetyltransferase [Dendronalium phyllosphericum]MBH8575442.1 GNAT family N-acetyltransferase [Dendronalium phyllosphericum CENA369]